MILMIKNYKSKKNISLEVEKRLNVLVVFIILLFTILIVKLFITSIGNKTIYEKQVAILKETIVSGDTAPRGRIYDRNHNLLVNNTALKTIYYKKPKDVSSNDEIALAYSVSNILSLSYEKVTTKNLKEFWMLLNFKKAEDKITKKEKELLKKRKLTNEEIYIYKMERITDAELNNFNESDKKAAYLYFLMNKGFAFYDKIIKNKDVTEEEYAFFAENSENYPGFGTKLDWIREYKYGHVFKTILGSVSSESQGIPAELSEYYLARGYTLNDRVGISYLEQQYEDVLRGEKSKFKVLANNKLELVSEGNRGNDIVLTIDINLQVQLEAILEEEIIKAKSEPNTQYYNKSFVIVSNPVTGEILAMAGKQILRDSITGEWKIYDYTPGIINSSVTAGSVVKGAAMTVGYKTKVIDIGTILKDECVKIKDTPLKCSWKTMGHIDDLIALKLSSNVYQYKIAMMVGGTNYVYNGGLSIDKKAYNTYRNIYSEFGLGIKTGIDLPNETTGYKGTSEISGHLLDFAIGQYDNYTSIQLLQYINTIASGGYRMQPYLLKEVYSANSDGSLTNLVYENNPLVLNKVDIEDKYLNRIKEGLKQSINGGVATGYINRWFDPVGKTGTAESFVDTNGDGKIDTETVTRTFAGYAPSVDPKMSIVAISPDITAANQKSFSNINMRLSQRISSKYFEIYK